MEDPPTKSSWPRGISPGRGLRRLEGKLRGMFIKASSGRSTRAQNHLRQQQQQNRQTDLIIQAALAQAQSQQVHMIRSGSLIRPHETLAPVREGPDAVDHSSGGSGSGHSSTKRQGSFRSWMMDQIEKTTLPLLGYKHSDVRLLLGVLGVPLAPTSASSPSAQQQKQQQHRVSPRDGPIESTSAQYILHQYMAASGGFNFLCSIHNSYAAGKIRMSLSEFETVNKVVRTKNPFKPAESGCFVLWQMKPEMWYVELAVGGSSSSSSKVHAGCDGKLVWRQSPWMGPHAAKGPVRPLRRALQGLDPLTTASVFSGAICVGEKQLNGEDCFVLKLAADPYTLGARSDGPAEIIRHVLFGYFSQRTGLLVRIEDSHLTRIQASAGEVVYWETSIESTLEDYRNVEGMVIAHCGHSSVTLFRFGEVAMGHTRTRMEEDWTIEEVALNVPGLSEDCFIPPADIRKKNHSDSLQQKKNHLHQNHSGKLRNGVSADHHRRGADLPGEDFGEDKSNDLQEHVQYAARVKAAAIEAQSNNVMWRVEG